jgi:hypothetical protein
MAFWMKQRGLRPIEGVFAGVLFALSLKETVHLHHWTFASSTCAWPWMMAGVDGFASTGRSRFLALTAFATCGTWIGSSPQMAYFGTGIAFVYALTTKRWPAIAAVPLGAALSAPLLWPVMELNALGPRGPGITYHFAASWSWPGRLAWEAMLLPRAWGGRPDFRGPMNYWELQGYFGLLPMALIPIAPWRKRALWLFAVLVVLCLWISFGDQGWLNLHWLAFRFLPGYGGFRNPTRALLPAMFCVAVIAAESLSRLRDEPKLRGRALFAGGALGVAVAAYAAFPSGTWPDLMRADAKAALMLLVAIGAWAGFARADARWALLAIPLYLADVGYQTWDSPEIGEAAAENHALEGLAGLVPAAPEPRRVAALLPWGEDNNATLARGWEGVTGYGPSPIDRVLRLLEATRTGRIRAPRPLDDDENFPRFRPESALVPLFGAPLLAADRDASVDPIARDGEVRLYRYPALPRVFWTGSWVARPDEESFQALQVAARGSVAVLAEPIPQPPGALSEAAAADKVEVHANTITADVTAPQDGLVVVLDPFFPGWHATVDGAPADLLRADYAFMAVPVKAGRHLLQLVYFPDRLLPGLLVAIVALALLAVLTRRVDSSSPRGYFPPP